MWMNRWEVEESVSRYRNHAVLGKATRFLYEFMEETNSVSDGWHSWPLPARAASRLMTLIQSGEATEAQFKASLGPIKGFYTRKGICSWNEVSASLAAAESSAKPITQPIIAYPRALAASRKNGSK